MERLILQPTSNKSAYDHFLLTVKQPVLLSKIKGQLSASDYESLSRCYLSGHCGVWGIVPGTGVNVEQWKKISRSDVVLFVRKSICVSSATVTMTMHNKELAKYLWGVDENGQTWEYLYFLDEICPQNIPVKIINKEAGYDEDYPVRRFYVLDESVSQILINKLKLHSAAHSSRVAQQVYESTIPTLDAIDLDVKRETTTRIEQNYLRGILFGQDRFGICCICGKSYPVELLVTAHIKKRCKCTDTEKRDVKNIVAPMCKFGCDELYERGIIGVIKGRVAVFKKEYCVGDVESYLNYIEGRQCIGWNEKNSRYFDWHAKNAGAWD